MSAVGGTVTEFPSVLINRRNVVRWLAPDPPHGNILYYNVRIRNDEIDIIVNISGNQLHLKDYATSDGIYSVQVVLVYRIITLAICSNGHCGVSVKKAGNYSFAALK